MGRLDDKRVVVTQADDYMGPATIQVFEAEGATVIADTSDIELRAIRVHRIRQNA